jgi:hypothetical protein
MGQRSLLMLGLVPRIGRLLVWPDHLFADYSPQMVPGYEGWTVNLIPGAMMLLCVAILFAASWRRSPVVSFGIAWFVIAYSPVANILIPSGILIAERTFMAPSVGVVLAAGAAVPWVIEKLKVRPRAMRLIPAGALAIVLALGVSESASRTATWKDSDTVFRTLVADAPLDFKAHYAYGGMLWDEKKGRDGELHHCDAAVKLYRKALDDDPSLPLVRVGLIACYLDLAQYRRARTEALVTKASGFDPRALDYLIEVSDSALVATDSGGGINQWTGHHRVRPRTKRR